VRYGLKVNQEHLGWAEQLARVRLAEELGFDGAWIFDHFKPYEGVDNCMEAWTLLAALAASTERIRLGALVTGVTYRHPAVLATQIATVDHISGGRLEVALGAAWKEDEHRELGIDFPGGRERVERLEEAVQVIRAVLTEDEAHFDGAHYRLDGVSYRPRPVQSHTPPIWIGAAGEQLAIPVAARHADVWHCFDPIETFPRKIEVFERAAEAAGRDPAEIMKAASVEIDDLDSALRDVDTLLRLGFGYIVIPWPGTEDARERVEAFAEQHLGPA
jgi:F420-dependent oxidoreductase-like protein